MKLNQRFLVLGEWNFKIPFVVAVSAQNAGSVSSVRVPTQFKTIEKQRKTEEM